MPSNHIRSKGTGLFVLAMGFLCMYGTSSAQVVLLDKESLECIECHESTSPKKTAPGQVVHKGGATHPVGVDYRMLASANRGLTRPSSLDPALRLVDGKLGCVTCHVPYSKINHQILSDRRKKVPAAADPMLTVATEGSRLCLACHNK